MTFDYAIHSDFLIHWTGKDIDDECNENHWYNDASSKTCNCCTDKYIKRLSDILEFGLWMTESSDDYKILIDDFHKATGIEKKKIEVAKTAATCFTELKLSESRKHAKEFGRLGIGVKRYFLFNRSGRPMVYYGPKNTIKNDPFLKECYANFKNKELLNFFKPMDDYRYRHNNYIHYAESEWRILYDKELKKSDFIIDPRESKNEDTYSEYLDSLGKNTEKLKYLIPLDGWLSMIIYPSLDVKIKARKELKIIRGIKEVKAKGGFGKESQNCPIEMDLDACRNF